MSDKPGPLRLLESVVLLLPLRLALGGLFIFAAWVKLSNPQDFAISIKAFEILDPKTAGPVIQLATFALPWAELICGVLLILGLFTRPAAALLALQLVVFTAAIASVLYRKLDVECGCFGDYDWPCGGVDAEGKPRVLGMCHIWRDLALLVPALILTFRGGGVLALDWRRERRQRCEFAPAPAPEDD